MNRRLSWVWCVAVAIAGIAPLAAQSRAATSVTLFNSGLVLVRRTLPIALPAGASTQTIALGNLTPASLRALDSGVTVTRINSDVTWSEDALLRRNIGHTFEFMQPDKTRRRATLLSFDPEHWEWADGGVVFGRPGDIIWPKEIVPTGRVVDVTLQSDRPRHELHVMYETNGGSWFADYGLFLGAAGRLEGVATVSAGTLDLTDAEVQLFAGDIGVTRYQPLRSSVAPTGGSLRGGISIPRDEVTTRQTVTVGERVGEAHLYTLPSRISFVAGVETVMPLFAPVAVHPERRYVVPGELSNYRELDQDGAEETAQVNVAYSLPHHAGTMFGNMPVPAGNVSVYDTDQEGRLQLVGQGSFDHTAAGADLQVESGTSFDVTARRTQTDYSATKAGEPLVTTAFATYRVMLENATDSAATVEVREDREGNWAVVESSVPAERRSANRAVFTVHVPANGTTTLTYRIRAVW